MFQRNNGIVEQVRLWDGLQSYYGLNSTGGTIAYDSVGGNNGVATSITWNANGKNSYCAEYNAATDNINCGNAFNWERTQAWSVSMWFKRVTVGTSAYFLWGKSLASGTYAGFGAYITSTNDGVKSASILSSLVNNGSSNSIQVRTTTSFTGTTDWYHVVWTYNGTSKASGLTVYTNGNAETPIVGYDSLSASILNSANFQIGARNSALSVLGLIDEVGVWNRALNEAEAKALYSGGNGKFYGTKALYQNAGQIEGLQSYWRFDESSGNAADSKGSYTLTNTNATYAAGKNNNCAIYTSGDYFENTSTNMGYGTAGTFTMWIWFDNYTAAYQIIDGSGGNTGINFQLYSSWLFFKVYGDSTFMSNNAAGAVQPVSGAWMFVGVSWNGTNRKIYSNNSVVSTTKNATSAPDGKLVVGSTAAHTYSLQGKLDELAYWNRQLSDTEIRDLYNAGNGIYY